MKPYRVDGPWTVSVAETPYDARAYSLYIKTPTHNLTLTRTAMELVELDVKLKQTHQSLPTLPIAADSVPTKKKNNFLNTLSRLASPSRRSTPTSLPTDTSDIFAEDAAGPSTHHSSAVAPPPPSATSTAIASYLTALANHPAVKIDRIWKRFVRVRTDDLESQRVDRPIKRVRSDLAAHTTPSEEGHAEHATNAPEEPQTPVASAPELQQRLPPRSQSADPDKSHRISRVYAASMPAPDESQTDQTGDESSSSAAPAERKARRKKRKEPKKSTRKVNVTDFEMMRVLGKGCAGKVLLVRHRSTADLFALKAITKRHVLAHQELQHTLTEQAVLKRMAHESKDPFVVKLWWSFHDKENLFLVMDFHPGGDLATQLARWGRLGRDRARFYAAEIVEGVEGLHAAGVIYRDLKPENILIGADGHIVLTDFGLSKEFPRKRDVGKGDFYSSVPGTPQPLATPPWMKTDKSGEVLYGWPGQPIGHTDSTTTFCGTAEYLAPEVIQGLPYSYEVDWWSFGTMLYEMLTGITPFWANNHSDMYMRVLHDELQFPDDRGIDQDTKSLIRGLLQRVPSLRICEPRIKRHPYFSMIDWTHVYYKRYIPPYIPPIDPMNKSDTQNFDDTFLEMEPVLDEYTETETDAEPATDGETDGVSERDSNTTPSQSRSSSVLDSRRNVGSGAGTPAGAEQDLEDVDVFDGYSFKGRHSVLLEDEDDTGSESGSEIGSGEESVLTGTRSGTETGTEASSSAVPSAAGSVVGDEEDKEDEAEPKTPEARKVVLPPDEVPPVDTKVDTKVDDESRPSSPPLPALPDSPQIPPAVPKSDLRPITPPPASSTLRPGRQRREKSGVPALDKYLSDAGDLEGDLGLDPEDDDWDIVDTVDGEDRNGAKGTSLFARGVVDKYKLVFKIAGSGSGTAANSPVKTRARTAEVKKEKPKKEKKERGRNTLGFRRSPGPFLKPRGKESGSRQNSTLMSIGSVVEGGDGTMTPRSTSGKGPSSLLPLRVEAASVASRSVSVSASVTPSTTAAASTPGSISASTSTSPVQHHTPPRSPTTGADSSTQPSTLATSQSMGSIGGFSAISQSPVTNGGKLGPSPRSPLKGAAAFGASTMPPSLRSKESAMSFGARSGESGDSNGREYDVMSAVFVDSDGPVGVNGKEKMKDRTGDKEKGKKLRRYKNGAEKMFSIFSPSKTGNGA